jgi:hypothetical protein
LKPRQPTGVAAGKVPIPGRFSCTIRDLSLDPSGRKGFPVSGLESPDPPAGVTSTPDDTEEPETLPTERLRTLTT